jgi:hypothetical protein
LRFDGIRELRLVPPQIVEIQRPLGGSIAASEEPKIATAIDPTNSGGSGTGNIAGRCSAPAFYRYKVYFRDVEIGEFDVDALRFKASSQIL